MGEQKGSKSSVYSMCMFFRFFIPKITKQLAKANCSVVEEKTQEVVEYNVLNTFVGAVNQPMDSMNQN
ncbi:hypothetical protein [Bacillus thuringiensis]|uniref:hypothetical protein n=1 Tax=Bacillus thuringiensis TaxID=1428 RepID=UPI0011A70E28|nr:hypothetical protein [Bacillus thuringiensis]